jgi:hypothetical protein
LASSRRVTTLLHLVELVACFAPGQDREGAQIIESAASKLNQLGIRHQSNIQKFVYSVNHNRNAALQANTQ